MHNDVKIPALKFYFTYTLGKNYSQKISFFVQNIKFIRIKIIISNSYLAIQLQLFFKS